MMEARSWLSGLPCLCPGGTPTRWADTGELRESGKYTYSCTLNAYNARSFTSYYKTSLKTYCVVGCEVASILVSGMSVELGPGLSGCVRAWPTSRQRETLCPMGRDSRHGWAPARSTGARQTAAIPLAATSDRGTAPGPKVGTGRCLFGRRLGGCDVVLRGNRETFESGLGTDRRQRKPDGRRSVPVVQV